MGDAGAHRQGAKCDTQGSWKPLDGMAAPPCRNGRARYTLQPPPPRHAAAAPLLDCISCYIEKKIMTVIARRPVYVGGRGGGGQSLGAASGSRRILREGRGQTSASDSPWKQRRSVVSSLFRERIEFNRVVSWRGGERGLLGGWTGIEWERGQVARQRCAPGGQLVGAVALQSHLVPGASLPGAVGGVEGEGGGGVEGRGREDKLPGPIAPSCGAAAGRM